MNQIIPAILPKSQSELEEKVSSVLGLVKRVQVDVCDGKFVLNTTGFLNLPYIDKIDYELDIMIMKPENFIDDFISLKPKSIVIHPDSVTDWNKFRSEIGKLPKEITVGIAFYSNETFFDLDQFALSHIDFVQFMGIQKIGFQNQPFDNRVLNSINIFKEKYPDIEIQIDGSVNVETIKILSDAGATRFVCGSSVFDGDVKTNIEKLESLLQ